MKRLALAVLLVLCMMIPQAAFADSMNLTVKGEESVKPGDIFEITVCYSASDIDRVDGQLQYNTAVLSYVSGGTNYGDGGVVSLKEASDNGRDITFNVKFKATGSGSADIKVSTNEAYNLDGRLLDMPQAQKTVQIEEPVEIAPEDEEEEDEPEITEEAQDEQEPAEIEDVDRNVGTVNFQLICSAAIAAFLLVILICIAARRKRRNRR